MSSWRDDPNGVPTWDERPKCHCGFRTWLQVCDDNLKPLRWGCRFFRCPDIDDNFKACTFVEWIDTKPNRGNVRPTELETKGQYYARMQEKREEERRARMEQERRVRQEQIRLKGKEDELQRRRATLGAREAALKRQEDEFQAREARLRQAEERNKARNNEAIGPSSERERKGKYPRSTQ